MDDKIFRKKSIERASSPDSLNNTIHVVQPGVWLLLGALILVFAAFFIWAIFGTMNSTAPIVVVSEDGEVGCYVSENDLRSVEPGMEVTVGDQTYILGMIDPSKSNFAKNINEYVAHMGDFDDDEYLYYFSVLGDVPAGTKHGEITTEKINAISFLWN